MIIICSRKLEGFLNQAKKSCPIKNSLIRGLRRGIGAITRNVELTMEHTNLDFVIIASVKEGFYER